MVTAWKMCSCSWLLCLAAACESVASEPVEDLLAATFKISQKEHSGTCFILCNAKYSGCDPRHVILVTAAHVLEEMPDSDCELIMRSGDAEQGFQRMPLTIEIRNDKQPLWTRHPDTDVAILLTELPENAAVKPIAIERLVNEAQLADRTVRVGQEAWIGCFPAKLESNEAGWPILRKGSIASFPLVPVKTAKTFMVDYSVFGGDSGAPIAIVHEGNLLIAGVASSMQRQTDKSSMPFEERTMHTPMGLSIAVHAVYLKETIELMLAE